MILVWFSSFIISGARDGREGVFAFLMMSLGFWVGEG